MSSADELVKVGQRRVEYQEVDVLWALGADNRSISSAQPPNTATSNPAEDRSLMTDLSSSRSLALAIRPMVSHSGVMAVQAQSVKAVWPSATDEVLGPVDNEHLSVAKSSMSYRGRFIAVGDRRQGGDVRMGDDRIIEDPESFPDGRLAVRRQNDLWIVDNL